VASDPAVGGDPEAAVVLDNFFPTPDGVRLRGGQELHATVSGAVTQLMNYSAAGSEKMFVTTASTLSEITNPAEPDEAPLIIFEGFSGGDWSYQQFATTGGDFIWAVNGVNYGLRYNGTTWEPVTDGNTFNLAYDGLTTTDWDIGETVTGGTSGATATIIGITRLTATTGVLKLGPITSGPYQDNEAITASGAAAVANGASAAAMTTSIAGVATNQLDFVWAYKRRLWFIEGGTLRAWWLPVDSITGTATVFPLSGVFRRGGSLLFGGKVSSDSGDGMDDRIVFVTTEGEVAVYNIGDPATADEVLLEGVYRIGAPLSKRGWFQTGGDLAILTEDGIVSTLGAMSGDRVALMQSAITAPIEGPWQSAVGRATTETWPVALWPQKTMLVVAVPADASGRSVAYVANAKTGAWARFWDWAITASVVHNGDLFLGRADGKIVSADTGGSDLGTAYYGYCLPTFKDGVEMMSALHARVVARYSEQFRVRLTGMTDYEAATWPTVPPITASSAAIWGTSEWGEFLWGGGTIRETASQWQTVYGNGYALGVGLTVGANATATPIFEPLAIQLQYEAGNAL
jgi:hypothetical protein